MSTEQPNVLNHESLSALMDGEAQEFELRRLLQTYPADAEIRAKWIRYQMASSIIRKQPLLARASLEFANTVQAAIQKESELNVSARQDSVGRYKVLARMAVAASVAMAVVTGVQWQQRTATETRQLAISSLPAVSHPQLVPVTGDPVVALTASVFTQPRDKQNEHYMQQHNLENVSLDTARVPLMNAADKRVLKK